MQLKLIRWFTKSAGALLLASALAKYMANWADAGWVQPHDPLLNLPMRSFFWVVGTTELCVALVCLFGRQLWTKLMLMCWVASFFVVYQLIFIS